MANDTSLENAGAGRRLLDTACLTLVGAAVGAMLLSSPAWSAGRGVPANPPPWNPGVTYDTANHYVTFRAIADRMVKQGVFVNAWWTEHEAPSFITHDGPWKLVGHALIVHPDGSMTVEVAPRWHPSAAYPGGWVISLNMDGVVSCFQAKNWTQGDNPAEPLDEFGWSPWEALATCPVGETIPAPGTPPTTPPETTPETPPVTPPETTPETPPVTPPETTPETPPVTPPVTTPETPPVTPPVTTPETPPVTPPVTTPETPPVTPPVTPPIPGSPGDHMPTVPSPGQEVSIDKLPPRPADAGPTLPKGSPIVPPMVATGGAELSSPAPSGTVGSVLPATGYAFLRQVGETDWNWLFPLRAGRSVDAVGGRRAPGAAHRGGAGDIFTLEAFRQAVLEYNRWAKLNNYKQFLNEGTLKQQGQEFAAFWAKASRETSGTWPGAPAPWIESYRDRDGVVTSVWKGGLHWVEELGYSTASDGSSPKVGYIDPSSRTFPAVPGRSYHGRGIIQMSWNYNYGAFSAWMHDQGLMRDVVTARDSLLVRPDLLATNGPLSMLSGIWFWMTPQGAKPSSHDVLYGDVTQVATGVDNPGLPALRLGMTVGGQSTGPVASGDTTDEGVMAYRLGTLTNILNGGLECHSVASWHPGPAQRISYYNAYATYLNERMNGLGATRVSKATDIWTTKISAQSDETVQSATCFNQKAYYTW